MAIAQDDKVRPILNLSHPKDFSLNDAIDETKIQKIFMSTAKDFSFKLLQAGFGAKMSKHVASWCDAERKLQASTIKTYLQIQQLKGGPRICLNKIPLLQDILSGVRNVPRVPRKNVKKTVSFPLLQILGQVVVGGGGG
jgi:hypothetical protein